MKTEFEKFYAKVLKGLEKSGVNIISNLGRISDIVTDYYGQTDMKYVIQCIKFELDRGFGKEKVPGIREATEADLVTEFDKNEDFDEFVDQVLDELDKYSDATVYDYYSDHRDEIGEFMDDDKDPSEVAELLSKYFNETGKPDEYDPEHEAYLKSILLKSLSSENPSPETIANAYKDSKSYFMEFKNGLLNKYAGKTTLDIPGSEIVENKYGECLKVSYKEKIDFKLQNRNIKEDILSDFKILPGVGINKEAKLKENWIDGEEQLFTATFKKPPFLGPFDEEKQFGDSFPDYLWAITVL